ncbi:MAG: sulfatase-like hydrolase/transferase [Planctomycetia bacterium]|nr:sulfatase-like hydrolase/transferase [Planctomycetia bacterium]
MSRRLPSSPTWPLLLAVCVAVLAVRAAPAADPAGKRPNILFIFSDDQSHRTVGCYPEAPDWVRTPHIDALAKSGVRFTHAYMGTWCTPSRATMLTGHHPHGVESLRAEGKYPGGTYDPAKFRFWSRALREHGYVTAQIGKWHTGTDTGAGRDWDHQIVWNRPKYPDNAFQYYYDQLIETNGGKAELVKDYATDNYTRWAVDFIQGKHRDPKKPWYLWLCYGASHGPYTPAERHLQDYPGVKVPTPADIFAPRAGKPDYVQKLNVWSKGADGQPVLKDGKDSKTLNDWSRQYQQCVSGLDEGIGKVLAALKESGQLENTLVVYTADQGFAWGQHGFQHKLAPYDANIRSPFIVSMPGKLPAGAVCNTPVGGVDLPPTLCKFAGLDLPWEMHGRDLTPLLTKPDRTGEHPVLTVFTGDKFGSDTEKIPGKNERYHGVPWWVSLTVGRQKYIRTLEEGEIEELYDLEKDPEELTNLALDPKWAERLQQLREQTVAELKRTKAPFVGKLPAVKQ